MMCPYCGTDHPGVTVRSGDPMSDGGAALVDNCPPWPEDADPDEFARSIGRR